MPTNASVSDIESDRESLHLVLGPHLFLQGTPDGFFRFRPSDTPGSTIVQIRPYIQEWNSLTIPLPLGALGRRVARRFISPRVGRGLLKRLPEDVLDKINAPTLGGSPSDALRLSRLNLIQHQLSRTQRFILQLSQAPWLRRPLRIPTADVPGAVRLGTIGGASAANRGLQVGTAASLRSSQAAVRQATLQQQALTRESNIIAADFNRAQIAPC